MTVVAQTAILAEGSGRRKWIRDIMRRDRTLLGAVVAVLALVTCRSGSGWDPVAESPPPPPIAVFELAPGVVVDGLRPALYIMRPGGGIEAVHPDSGEVHWNSHEGDKPLWASGDLLLAQREPGPNAGSLSLALIDVTRGGRETRRLEVPLPDQVSATVQQGLGLAFTTTSRLYDDDVLITWRFVRRDISGAPPAGPQPPPDVWEGALQVDLDAAEAVEIDPTEARQTALAQLPTTIRHRVESGELRVPPPRVGQVFASVTEKDRLGGGLRLVLDRWDAESGRPLPEIVLLDRRPVARLVSADRHHLLVATVEEAGAWERYRWTIHSLETGEAVATARSFMSVAPFFVRGGLLIHVRQPHRRLVGDEWIARGLELRAVSFADGQEQWTRPVRDTGFRGPLPPQH